MKHNLGLFFIFIAGLLVAACAGDDEAKLPGKRIPVLLGNLQVEPDPTLQDVPIALPKPSQNNGWPQYGGFSDHANYHLALGDELKEIWSISAGSFNQLKGEIVQPVIADRKLFVLDQNYHLRAFDIKDGRLIWEFKLDVPDEDDNIMGGGIAYHQGRVYVATGYRGGYAIDAKTGQLIWDIMFESPIRAPPTIGGGRMVVITLDNQARAYDLVDGSLVWRHFGISESAGLRGGAAAAIDENITIFAYSSGEIFAVRTLDGRVLWEENLASLQPLNALANLADIKGNPVIDRGVVYVVGHAGRMLAIDASTGVRAWERAIGGVEMPWAAGDYVFVVDLEATLIALTRRGGRVHWRRFLAKYEDADAQDHKIHWHGPVLAGDRLLLSNNMGEIISISPYDGDVLGMIRLAKPIVLPPIVSDRTLYIVQEGGTITAYR